jgi:hypothetical protein
MSVLFATLVFSTRTDSLPKNLPSAGNLLFSNNFSDHFLFTSSIKILNILDRTYALEMSKQKGANIQDPASRLVMRLLEGFSGMLYGL